MTVERGLSLIYLREQSNENNPTNSLVVPKLTQHNGAVLYLAENNSSSYGKTPEEVKEASERDHWMTAEEAKEFGLVDKIITAKK